MVEFKKATAEDGRMLRELFEEFVDLDRPGLTDDDCRRALNQAESMMSVLVADEDTEGRLWMDVPGAIGVLRDTRQYLQTLWGELMSRGLQTETARAVVLIDNAGARLGEYDESQARARQAIDKTVVDGNIVIPSRKTQQSVKKLLGEE